MTNALSFRIGLGLTSILPGGGVAPPPIASVNALGWNAEWAGGTPPTFSPDTAPMTMQVSRQGFDATGAPATWTDTRIFTKRVRQPYPNDNVLTATTVALDDYIYATDSIAGVVNNSAETSPKAISKWLQSDRKIVGNTLSGELFAVHRDGRAGKPVACVVVTATDRNGVSVSQTIPAPGVSPSAGDWQAVLVYAYSLDITGLAPGKIRLNALVYPWLGAAGSVLDSSATANDSRTFCEQWYYKNVARAADPPRCYIGGANASDATGVFATSSAQDAAAKASPFATYEKAIEAALAALGAYNSGTDTGGIDGTESRFRSGTWAGTRNVTFNFYQGNSAVKFCRDTAYAGSTRANTIIQSGANAFGTQLGIVIFEDVTRQNMGPNVWFQLSRREILRNVDFDANNLPYQLSQKHLYIEGGTTILNAHPSSLQYAAGVEMRLLRGVKALPAGGLTVDDCAVFGCQFNQVIFTSTSHSQGMLCFNKVSMGRASVAIPAGGSNVIGYAVVQNAGEWTTTVNNVAFGPSCDGDTANITHLIDWHNTWAGANLLGRSNSLYDEAAGTTRRTHKLQSVIGPIHTQSNTKGDRFVGENQGNPSEAPFRVGNWSFLYGVGCRDVHTIYIDAGGGAPAFRQEYPGLRASIGTSNVVRNDPLFVNYQGVTFDGSAYTAGVGGSDLRLQAGSPCKGKVPNSPLPFDLAGNPRSMTAASKGAYE